MLQTEGCYVTENNESKSIKSYEAHKKYLIFMRLEQFSTEYWNWSWIALVLL